jgi:hypothetical protein
MTDFNRSDVLIQRKQQIGGRVAGGFDDDSPEIMAFKREYAKVITHSKFVLCPRGYGTSSIRLFETMQSGRVPVIISDAWVPCSNIQWSKCSLRVPEKDISKLANICLNVEKEWITMATEARRTWEEWFSHMGLAKLIETSIREIKHGRRLPEAVLRPLDWPVRRSVVLGHRLAGRSYSAGMRWVRSFAGST